MERTDDANAYWHSAGNYCADLIAGRILHKHPIKHGRFVLIEIEPMLRGSVDVFESEEDVREFFRIIRATIVEFEGSK